MLALDAAAAVQSGKLNKRTGTPLYMAPELFMRYYGVESDQVMPYCAFSLLWGILSAALLRFEPFMHVPDKYKLR